MNKIALFLLLALVAPVHAQWARLGFDILGNNYDYVTLRNPSDGDSIVFRASDRKWIAGSGGGMSSLAIQTDGVAQGTATTLNFTNGLRGSGGTTGNVSPTYGTSANTFTQGNDARLPLAPAAGRRGDVVVYDAAGTAMTAIDAGTATDQAYFSLGANTPGAFRVIATADVDEILALTDLTGVTATTGSGTTVPFATSPTLTTPVLVNPTINNTGTTVTVLHGNATGGTAFAVVTPADAAGNTSGSGNFALVTSPALTTPILSNPTINNTGTTVTVLHGNATGGTAFAVVTPADAAGNTSGSGNFALVTSPTLATPILNNPTINNTGTASTVLHGASGGVGATQFGKVVAADATVTGTGDTFVMSESPAISGTLTCPILTNGGAATVKIDETNGFELRTDAGASGSTFVPSAGAVTVNVDGAAGALTLAAGDRYKLTGQAGAPATFDAGSLAFDTTGSMFVAKSATGNVTLSGCAGPPLLAASTVTGQTSFTDIGPQLPTAASSLAIGSAFRLDGMMGTFGTNSTDTFEWQLLYNATVIASFAAGSPGTGLSNELVEVNTFATIRSIGASGTVAVSAVVSYRAGSSVFSRQRNVTAVPVTIDTTAAGTWKWQVKHGSSNAANTITMQAGAWTKVN